MQWWTVVLVLGACARITRFLTDDVLGGPVRSLWRRLPWAAPGRLGEHFITCPWCVSIWVAGVVVPAGWWFGDRLWFAVPAAVLTGSHVIALTAQNLDGE